MNQYRRESSRLQNWDYASEGYYFITICTKNKKHYFGEIIDGEMILSHIGVIATILWQEIKHRFNHISLGEFVVMPNHIHCIISVETRHVLSLQNNSESRFQNQGKKTISSMIGSYKSAVSKYAHQLNYEFHWQGRFYDHIIRNDVSHRKISEYVLNNPQKWEEDRFYG